MMEFIKNSAFFGAMISLIAYEIGLNPEKRNSKWRFLILF